ncbi:MAG: hypothetical protein N4A70_13580 [Pelagimonas sp.]|jgi:hypothetical protein|nr:hypothetical protein [Pelagimonas sp.]
MPRDNVQISMGGTPLKLKIDQFFAEKGLDMTALALRRARLKHIIMLEAQSDTELARSGLTRDDILPFVYADIFS